MFDIGFLELCVIGVVALLVLGPERLPRAARTAGMWAGRAKRMIAQVKRDIDDELRQEELKELKAFREAKDALAQTKESLNSFKDDLNKTVDAEAKETKNKKGDADKKDKQQEKPVVPEASSGSES
jgi:sec-independent protein translocase protein TatB